MKTPILIVAAAIMAGCATGGGQYGPMPDDWGPGRFEGMPEPFRMPARGASLERRKRLYFRTCMSVGAQGLVVGHHACSLADAERYLELSGAHEQSKNLRTIRKNKEGWAKGAEIAFMIDMARTLHAAAAKVTKSKFPAPPPATGEEVRAHLGADMVAQEALNHALEKPIVQFNRRLAAALGLSEGADVDSGAQPVLPPPLEELELGDLDAHETWREFEADYKISRRQGRWFVGEAEIGQGELVSWLQELGYDKAAARLSNSGVPDTGVMQNLAEVNARIPAHLEILARVANPALFPKAEGGSVLPGASRRDGVLSARELEDQ